MARQAVGELRVGMVLSSPAIGSGGRQLVPAGVPLGEQHLQILRAWGVESVDVADAAVGAAGGDAAAAAAKTILVQRATQAAQRSVAPRFRGQPVDHPAIRALFTAAVAREIRRAGKVT